GPTQRRCRGGVGGRVDADEVRRRNAERAEQRLLGEAVLRCGNRRRRREHVDRLAQRLERCDGNVLYLEGYHVDSGGKLSERSRIVERALTRLRDLRARSIRRAIENGAIDAERITGEREHATELAGADDTYAGSCHARGSGATAGVLRRGARIGMLE